MCTIGISSWVSWFCSSRGYLLPQAQLGCDVNTTPRWPRLFKLKAVGLFISFHPSLSLRGAWTLLIRRQVSEGDWSWRYWKSYYCLCSSRQKKTKIKHVCNSEYYRDSCPTVLPVRLWWRTGQLPDISTCVLNKTCVNGLISVQKWLLDLCTSLNVFVIHNVFASRWIKL